MTNPSNTNWLPPQNSHAHCVFSQGESLVMFSRVKVEPVSTILTSTSSLFLKDPPHVSYVQIARSLESADQLMTNRCGQLDRSAAQVTVAGVPSSTAPTAAGTAEKSIENYDKRNSSFNKDYIIFFLI